METKQPLDFYSAATTVMGGFVGLLIALPLAGSAESPTQALAPMIAFPLLGLLGGYRRRHSRFFFYFCLIAIATLSTIIAFKTQPTP